MLAAIALLVVGMFATSALGSPLDVTQIVLRADNGKYLSRINRSFGNPIEAAKDIPDIFCIFTVLRNGDDTYSFIADDYMYLSRIERDGKENIEAAKKTIDYYSRFSVIGHGDGTISLQADDGKYLSRINRGTNYNPIEVVKDSIDAFSKFKITEVGVAGAKFKPV